MNYEAYRAMYEGRNAQLFHPTTAVITWMSNPAQPSFVWQLYHYDLEPNASLFAVRSAGELEHIQFNQANGEVQVINNLPQPLENAVAHETVYNLDGTVCSSSGLPLHRRARHGHPTRPGRVPRQCLQRQLPQARPRGLRRQAPLHQLLLARQQPNPDDLSDLDKLPAVTLDANVDRADADGQCRIAVTLHNPTKSIALMAHVQLRRKSGDRVLPVFYDNNYVSLAPGETRTIHIEADLSDLRGEDALVVLDGWNTLVATASAKGVSIATNAEAQPSYWPDTGLPFQTVGLRQ